MAVMQPIKKAAMPVDVTANQTYTKCGCGLSQTLPLCDVSQQTAGNCQFMSFAANQTVSIFCARVPVPTHRHIAMA